VGGGHQCPEAVELAWAVSEGEGAARVHTSVLKSLLLEGRGKGEGDCGGGGAAAIGEKPAGWR
jgi:hypothetical protein